MKLNFKFLIVLSFFFLTYCAEYKYDKISDDEKKYYSSHGFALIYDKSLFDDRLVKFKIDNNKFVVLHDSLKKNTPIKIINPENSKEIELKISKNVVYPSFFNIVVSKKIADFLEIDQNNPYIELYEIKKNKKFVAKESNIFDEEKNVAEKAPVKEVKIADLSESKNLNNETDNKKKSFILVIGDFYYIDSANKLKNQLINDTGNKNFSIKEIKTNQYRLYAGPFKNFNTLKSTYISLNNLGFDDLNVFQE